MSVRSSKINVKRSLVLSAQPDRGIDRPSCRPTRVPIPPALRERPLGRAHRDYTWGNSRQFVGHRMLQRSMCPPHANAWTTFRRTASWTDVSTTLSVELSTRQPDPSNNQKSEPRAKRKSGDEITHGWPATVAGQTGPVLRSFPNSRRPRATPNL